MTTILLWEQVWEKPISACLCALVNLALLEPTLGRE